VGRVKHSVHGKGDLYRIPRLFQQVIIVLAISCLEGAGQVATRVCPQDDLHPCKVSAPSPLPTPKPPPASVEPGLGGKVVKRFLHTQADLWTAPRRMRLKDFQWILPAGGMTASLIASDSRTAPEFQRSFDQHNAGKLSDLGVGAYAGVSSGLYLLGKWKGNAQLRVTGELVAESMIHSLVMTEVSKYAFGRERPTSGRRTGHFWQGGDSFPSAHAMLAWSAATTLAHRHPGPMTKLTAYGGASAISLARVFSGKHYTADVFVGGLGGYLIGRQIVRNQERRDAELRKIGTVIPEEEGGAIVVPSAYVPLDHWAYATVERLAALAVVDSAFLSQRPWTAEEFLRIAEEADASAVRTPAPAFVPAAVKDLRAEFAARRRAGDSGISWDSVYADFVGVQGRPLNDDYHFGRTVSNDYGRPLQSGANLRIGSSSTLTLGKLIVHVQGEYQHAGTGDARTSSEMAFIAGADGVPSTTIQAPRVDRFKLLEGYAAYASGPFQFSFGYQNLWWGFGRSGSLNLSSNAAPILAFKIDQTSGRKLPGLLSVLGPFRTQFFLGRLDGHQFVTNFAGRFGPHLSQQPLIHGERLTFKPTPNLEIAFSVSTLFGSDGYPLNARTFLRSFGISNTIPGAPADPGDRRAGFDFSYRIPGLRDRVTLYSDSMTEDEFSPIAYPRRSAVAPGLLISRLPGLSKAELRLEGAYTDLPGLIPVGSYYSNNRFRNGFTNEGGLMGHPVGRQGTYYFGSLRYWFTPKKTLEASFRKLTLSREYLPGGGNSYAWMVKSGWELQRGIYLDARLQYENWLIPVIVKGSQDNLALRLNVRIAPSKVRD
jgi:hypothetical protein